MLPRLYRIELVMFHDQMFTRKFMWSVKLLNLVTFISVYLVVLVPKLMMASGVQFQQLPATKASLQFTSK